ncbi:torsin-4A-like [Heptranchias perlo]|uniref:torsin-4A-like n=1 Tax=Heptranchias perlo TaxID=212740 RepID=UPI00355ACBAD
MSELVGTTCQASGEHPKEEAPEGRRSSKSRLARATMKIRLANRVRRGKLLSRAQSNLSTSLHHPLKRKSSSRKFGSKKKSLQTCGKKWWSFDHETKAMFLLYLLSFIVGLQVYNAYENLDDNLLIYDIDELEKTLHRDLLGQTLALNKLTKLMRGYFSTYVHAKPLFLSINGPAGVGKSHLGRLIAKHFKFELGPDLVLQHSMKYQRLMGHSHHHSQRQLSARISDIFSQALQAERIPVFLFDEMELAPTELLSFIGHLLESNRTSAVYIFISNVGQDAIAQSVRRSFSPKETIRVKKLSVELAQLFAWQQHPVWWAPEIIPLSPLDRAHVVRCFRNVMDREGFYPHDPRVETMANTLYYYRARNKLYSQRGCKDVLSMVKQLSGRKRAEKLGNKIVS